MQIPRPRPAEGRLQAAAARKALSGFLLAGLLMSFPGAILPAWGYHLRSDFSTTGFHFLAMALGILTSAAIAHRLVARKGTSFVLVVASGLACASILYLSLVVPPASSWWRLPGLLLVGVSAGLLISALFHAISPIYRHDPAATVNIAGVLFVLGSLVMALLVSGTFYVYTVPSILFLLALVPGFYAAMYAGTSFTIETGREEPSWRQALMDSRRPSAVLFALLLFFQFGNEWSIAGWLAVFLIRRLGMSPASSLLMLALYWLALLVGRVVAQFLLPRFRHEKLLALSMVAALFGCVVLSFTNNVFGAVSGVLFVGAGFAMIYPLAVARIGYRFPYFHPGLFNGVFSFAMLGGLLAPWTVGHFADLWGIGVVMMLPLLGTVMVSLLLALIWLEARLSGGKAAAS